ncbi:MAG: hypothetical protein ABIK93_03970 [candidate division WOR-3 bacterium]
MILFIKFFKDRNNNTKKESELTRPYCKKFLPQMPTRKKKCPFCQNYIFVRTLPKTKEKVLVTNEDAKKIDVEWGKIQHRLNRLNKLSEVGISEADFCKRVGKTIEEATDQEIKDIIWSKYNELVMKYTKSNDFGVLKTLYYRMALFLDEEGKDFFQILQQSAKMELMNFRQSKVIKKVEILTAGENSCESCQQLAAKVFTIEEALKNMPIPNKECSFKMFEKSIRGFCRCCYNAVID